MLVTLLNLRKSLGVFSIESLAFSVWTTMSCHLKVGIVLVLPFQSVWFLFLFLALLQWLELAVLC